MRHLLQSPAAGESTSTSSEEHSISRIRSICCCCWFIPFEYKFKLVYTLQVSRKKAQASSLHTFVLQKCTSCARPAAGFPKNLSVKAYLLLGECQKRDVPEQSHTWCVVEPFNTKSFKDTVNTVRLEFGGRLWHAGWTDHCFLP